MDLQTESIYKEDMSSDPRRFMPLFDENYSGLYRFVARRIEDEVVREQIVRISILDAIGQMETCPKDINFLTWLYKIAKERVGEYAKKGVGGMSGTIESPIFDGASVTEGVYDDEYKLKQQAEGYFSLLTYDEKEIVRLKFFEELTDGEVMYVMGFSAGNVGAKIYQVLKRSYEVLFGKVDEYAGVYYGELYSFLSRLKGIEKIPVPEVFKLKLKAEVINKLDKMYADKFGQTGGGSDEASYTDETGYVDGSAGTDDDFGMAGDFGATGVAEAAKANPINVGSGDPAKAFVYAAKGMSKEEIDEITREYVADREVGKKKEEKITPDDSNAYAEDIVENVPVQYQSADEYADEMYDNFVDKLNNFWTDGEQFFQVSVTAIIALCVVFFTVVWFTDESVTLPPEGALKFIVNYNEGFSNDQSDEAVRTKIEKDLISKIAEGKKIISADVSREEKTLNIDFDVRGDGGLAYVFDVKGDNLFRVKSFKETD